MIAEHDWPECVVCGATFQRLRRPGKPVVTCSEQCRRTHKLRQSAVRCRRWRDRHGLR